MLQQDQSDVKEALTSCTGRHPEHVSESIFPATLQDRLEAEAYDQVDPVRIVLLDQVNLPRAVPALELLLARNRVFHRRVKFVPDQKLAAIPPGEALDGAFSMLPNPLRQVGRDADIQRAIASAGQDVHCRLKVALHRPGLLRRYAPRNDEVQVILN